MKTKKKLISQSKHKLEDMEKTISPRGDASVSLFFFFKNISQIYLNYKSGRIYLFNNILYHSVATNYWCPLFRHFTFPHTELARMTSTHYLNCTSMKYAVAQKNITLVSLTLTQGEHYRESHNKVASLIHNNDTFRKCTIIYTCDVL